MTSTLIFDHECSRCCGGAHEIVDEWNMVDPRSRTHEPYVTLWCVYCGMRCDIPKQQVAVGAETTKESQPDAFRFATGRFEGMTLAETDSQPNGRKYLEWMARNNEKLGGRIAEYLAQVA